MNPDSNVHEIQETDLPVNPDDELDEDNQKSPEKLTRQELLKITGDVIQYLKRKATGGRFADQDLEKMRDSKMRLLLEACKVHASILKDESLDELEARIARLEEINES